MVDWWIFYLFTKSFKRQADRADIFKLGSEKNNCFSIKIYNFLVR